MEFSAKIIAQYLNGQVEGDENVTVSSVSKIESGKKGTLTFLSNLKYTQYIYDTEASIVLVNKDFKPEKPVKPTLIRVDNAYECLAKLLQLYQNYHHPVLLNESSILQLLLIYHLPFYIQQLDFLF